MIVHGQHGLLIAPREAVKVACAIRWIHQNRSDASRMVRAARARVAEAYSVPRLVADFRLIYGES